MINVNTKSSNFNFEGCNKQVSFNFEGYKIRLYCSKHKQQ